MQNTSSKRPNSANRRKRVVKDERTKFDKWLERMRDDRSPVEISFAIPVHDELPALTQEVQVMDVDRYMVFLEFPNWNSMWVAKSIIVSAGDADQ